MDMAQALAIGLGVVLTALMGAVGWLVSAVVNQGHQIAAIRAATEQKDDAREEIRELVREATTKIADQHSDVKLLCERTTWLQRTADRHERYLEAGRADGEKQ